MSRSAVLVFATLFFLATGFAQQTTVIKPEYRLHETPYGTVKRVPADLPVIGLALSGGGARGFAQIGVLRALEEAGIPFELIVGTSMGSIVGGLYAIGYTPQEMTDIAKRTDWNDILTSETTNRGALFVDQKITDDKAVFSLSIEGYNIVIPTSINLGQKLLNRLSVLTLQAPGNHHNDFNDFEIPYRAVTTNLETGEPYVFRTGTISQAMRASSSVTFLLSPLVVDSLILVDGGLVANIPAEITRQEGAEFVIAVNTTSHLHKREALDLPWNIADQVVSIPMRIQNRNQLRHADFIIEPDIKSIDSDDFTVIDQAAYSGYYSTQKVIPRLQAAIDSIRRARHSEIYTNVVAGHENTIGLKYLQQYEQSGTVSASRILKDLYRLEAEGKFRDLSAVLQQSGGRTVIQFEGEPTADIKRVKLFNAEVLNAYAVKEIIASYLGKVYTEENLRDLVRDMLMQFRREGYSLAEIDNILFDEAEGILKLSFLEGQIHSFSVTGNESTNRTVITREIPLEKGDIFTIAEAKEGLRNLRATNLFEKINLKVNREYGKNHVVVEVQEQNPIIVRFGFKVADENTPQVSIDLRNHNILGSATELGFLFYAGSRARSLIAEHRATRIFNTYLTYNVNAYYKHEDIITYREELNTSETAFSMEKTGKYRQSFYGASIGVGTQVERFGNLIFEAKYEVNELSNLERFIFKPFEETVLSLKASTTIDTKNRYPFPTNGIYFNAFYQTAVEAFGGDVSFTKFGASYEGFLTLNNIHTFKVSSRIGFADNTTPLTQHYSLGGQYSFFGMRMHEMRGRQIFRASLGYRVKLPFRIFFDTYFRARYDIGSTWEEAERIRLGNLRHGIGGMLSFDTPIGPADFALGRQFLFTKDLPSNPLRTGPIYFYFSIGYYY